MRGSPLFPIACILDCSLKASPILINPRKGILSAINRYGTIFAGDCPNSRIAPFSILPNTSLGTKLQQLNSYGLHTLAIFQQADPLCSVVEHFVGAQQLIASHVLSFTPGLNLCRILPEQEIRSGTYLIGTVTIKICVNKFCIIFNVICSVTLLFPRNS